MTKTFSVLALVFGLLGFSAQSHAATKIGVGVDIDFNATGHLIVNSVFPGSPADKSGLIKAGDEITAIQSTPNVAYVAVSGRNMDSVSALMKGDAGIAIGLQLVRAGAPLAVTIVRGPFEAPDQFFN